MSGSPGDDFFPLKVYDDLGNLGGLNNNLSEAIFLPILQCRLVVSVLANTYLSDIGTGSLRESLMSFMVKL